MQTVGLIGVGNIGKHYTRKLRAAGYPLTVLDIKPENVAWAVEQGAHAAGDPAELTARSEVILLSLPSSKEVESVMEGERGVLSALRSGQLVIDTGTSRAETDVRYAARCAEHGVGFLDAPITWRAPGLIIMAGGGDEDYAAGQAVLETISYKVRHVGPLGSGQALKQVNQLLQAGQLAVYCEGIEFAKQSGLDPALVSEYLEFAVPASILTDDHSGGGQLALHYKDLGYILDHAHDTGAFIPITALVHEVFKATHRFGDPNWIQPGIVTFWQRLNHPQDKD